LSTDLRVCSDDLEGFFDLLGSGATTNIQEVGWFSSVQLNNVHGSHGKTGSVNETSNIACMQ
jgi:hypothetical protein